MSSPSVDARSVVRSLAGSRLRTADDLLPDPISAEAGCGAELVVTGEDEVPAGIGTCEHWVADSGSLDETWGALARFRLDVSVAGPDVAGALDGLLSRWREHLSSVPGVDEPDTSAIVSWPSRDIDGIMTLQRHGLTPLGVVAARLTGGPAGRYPGSPGPGLPAGVTIRRAVSADLGEVTRLGIETIRFDAHFGNVTERPGTESALRGELAALLDEDEPWVWLAERDGAALGMLAAEPPKLAEWIAPLVRRSPVAYLMLMFVEPNERASGIGAAMTRGFHREVAAADVPVTLLHFEQTNPLSAPFWSQHGYRPLWTSWEARPARTLR